MVALYHVHHVRAVDVVILQFAAIGPKTDDIAVFAAKIEMRAISIIEEKPVRNAMVQPDVKRHVAVQRIFVFFKRVIVGTPEAYSACRAG